MSSGATGTIIQKSNSYRDSLPESQNLRKDLYTRWQGWERLDVGTLGLKGKLKGSHLCVEQQTENKAQQTYVSARSWNRSRCWWGDMKLVKWRHWSRQERWMLPDGHNQATADGLKRTGFWPRVWEAGLPKECTEAQIKIQKSIQAQPDKL